jgi:hypothetical protein
MVLKGALGSVLSIDSLYCEGLSYIEIIRKSFGKILFLGKIFFIDIFNSHALGKIVFY